MPSLTTPLLLALPPAPLLLVLCVLLLFMLLDLLLPKIPGALWWGAGWECFFMGLGKVPRPHGKVILSLGSLVDDEEEACGH